MKQIHTSLGKQLVGLICVAFIILFVLLGIILPKVLIPVAENNIYSYLREPLKLVNDPITNKLKDTEIAYLYVTGNDKIVSSENLNQVIQISEEDLLKYITSDHGKFTYKYKVYYYSMIGNSKERKISITNDSYINKTKTEILSAIFPIILITCILVGLIITIWSSFTVKRIEKLKAKIDNIDNPDYNHDIDSVFDDEIKSLSLAIEDMRLSLLNQEEYRNQMYQNISHDFKTPLTVIKSYIEAVEDDVEDEKNALKIIKEQTSKLENKVHSLLYLNKLDYLKNSKSIKLEPIDIEKIINKEIEKFKFYRKDINFIVDIDKKVKFYGTIENWESIFDNLLSNFMRYTNTTIKIMAKPNKIILFNDGDNIADDLLDGIFTPFRKGIKGEFGLGLSIVKKTLNIMHYDIVIRNEKIGVSFIITKRN